MLMMQVNTFEIGANVHEELRKFEITVIRHIRI